MLVTSDAGCGGGEREGGTRNAGVLLQATAVGRYVGRSTGAFERNFTPSDFAALKPFHISSHPFLCPCLDPKRRMSSRASGKNVRARPMHRPFPIPWCVFLRLFHPMEHVHWIACTGLRARRVGSVS